jgi:hypothetical protein
MAQQPKPAPPRLSRREQLAAQRLAAQVREADRLAEEWQATRDPRERADSDIS